MHAPLALCAVALATVAGSCDPAAFQQPLADPAKAKADPRLVGTWATRDHDNQLLLVVAARTDGPLDVTLVGASAQDGVNAIAWQGLSAQVGGATYLDLREKRVGDAWKQTFELSPTWLVARYQVTADTLTLDYLSNEALAADGGLSAALPTPALQDALKHLPPSAFSRFHAFKRVKLP